MAEREFEYANMAWSGGTDACIRFGELRARRPSKRSDASSACVASSALPGLGGAGGSSSGGGSAGVAVRWAVFECADAP